MSTLTAPFTLRASAPKEKKLTPSNIFKAGDHVNWSPEALSQSGIRWLIDQVKNTTGKKDGILVKAIRPSLSGSHAQSVEIENPHPHGIRTWICGSWLTKTKS